MQPNTTDKWGKDGRTSKHEFQSDFDATQDSEARLKESWDLDRRTFMKAGTLLGFASSAFAGVPTLAAGEDISDPWGLQQKLLASDGGYSDYFGRSEALSADGSTALIGSPSGAAYVFIRSGETWVEQEKLLPNDGGESNSFGGSVALSAGGNVALVGAYRDSEKDGENGLFAGAAYVFTRSEGTWTEQQKLLASDGTSEDNFGSAVALSADGNTALIAAERDDETAWRAGSAYIFVQSNGVLVEDEKLLASDAAESDLFGTAVALSANGETALIGARGNDDNGSYSGSAYVFTQSNESWSEQEKLLASNGSAFDRFGIAVDLSDNGDTALIGASGTNDVGSAYIFSHSDMVWEEQEELVASNGSASDRFGIAVDLSDDGDTALIGAHGVYFYQSGSAYVYTHTEGTWTEQQELLANDELGGGGFGIAVALSSDGDTALIGAYTDGELAGSAGAAYVFARSNDTEVNQPPIASLEYSPHAPYVNEEITFDASASTDPDGEEILSYEWDFGDGTTAIGQTVTHTYATEGDYDVSLTVADSEGATATGTQIVSVVPVPNASPTAAFEYSPEAPKAGEEATFDASDSTDPDGEETISYEWAFGDGTTGTGQITTHTYIEDGDYEVTLVVSDEADATDEETQTVSVAPAALFADPLLIKGREYQPQDLDGDGLYEDLDGDGRVTGRDTAALAHIIGANRKGDVALTEGQVAALDFNGDGRLTGADMGAYNQVRKSRRNNNRRKGKRTK